MTKWREVSAYSGQPVEEDAPTNFAGTGSGVDMNPTGMKKKKKKLIDARSKSYKTHRLYQSLMLNLYLQKTM
mgnify:CR=1 FL=1